MLEFDTRNKKPKVWNIAVTSVVFVVVMAVLLTRPQIPVSIVAIVVGAYLALDIFFLLRAWVRQVQYNPYSYNTIYYMGFTVFLAVVLVSHTLLMVQLHQTGTTDAAGMANIFGFLLGSAKTFMLFSLPFILFYSIVLCVSNISLIRHEGRRLVNILGIILSALMLGGEAFLFFADYYVSGSLYEVMVHDLLTNLFAALYLYFECMLLGSIFANVLVVRYEPKKDKDYIIILGCGIRKDGMPTPLLAGRINRALKFARAQEKKTGKAPVFIPSGGQGPNEVISESESMRNYLLEKGVPETQIRMEDKSRNTRENMLFSKKIIESEKPKAKVAFSTTNYHIFRSGLLARRVKMRAVGMGARTKWYFWPNAAVREFVGILTEHRLKQGLILGSMIAIYIIGTLAAYLTWF